MKKVVLVLISILLMSMLVACDDGKYYTCGYCGDEMSHYYDYIDGEYTCYSCSKSLDDSDTTTSTEDEEETIEESSPNSYSGSTTQENSNGGLTDSQKKEICNYIQSRYDYYDYIEGGYAGDKYSDVIMQEASSKYGLSVTEIEIIWMKMYSY